MKGSYLGPAFSDDEIEDELKLCGAVYKKLSEDDLIEEVAKSLIDEKAPFLNRNGAFPLLKPPFFVCLVGLVKLLV